MAAVGKATHQQKGGTETDTQRERERESGGAGVVRERGRGEEERGKKRSKYSSSPLASLLYYFFT